MLNIDKKIDELEKVGKEGVALYNNDVHKVYFACIRDLAAVCRVQQMQIKLLTEIQQEK